MKNHNIKRFGESFTRACEKVLGEMIHINNLNNYFLKDSSKMDDLKKNLSKEIKAVSYDVYKNGLNLARGGRSESEMEKMTIEKVIEVARKTLEKTVKFKKGNIKKPCKIN